MKFERAGYWAIILLMILGFTSPIYFVGKSEYLQRENMNLKVSLANANKSIVTYEKVIKVINEEVSKSDKEIIDRINSRLSGL